MSKEKGRGKMTNQAGITRQYAAIQAVEAARAGQHGLRAKGLAAMRALQARGFVGEPSEFPDMTDGDRDLVRRMAAYAARED